MLFWFHSNIRKKEFKIFPSPFFGFEKPVWAIPNLAHLLLPSSDANADAKSKELNPIAQQIGVLPTFFARALSVPQSAPQAYGVFILFFLFSLNIFSQGIKQPESPTFQNGFNSVNVGNNSVNRNENNYNNSSKNNNAEIIEANKNFSTTYKAPSPNASQNQQTLKVLEVFKEVDFKSNDYVKKQLWELKLKYFKFADPNSEEYKKLQPLYEAAFDSINAMLTGARPLDLKKAIFLVENVYYHNKIKYSDYCNLINNKVAVLKQIIKKENLNTENNIALNYAIQQLYTKQVKYTDKNGVIKIHQPLKYDFEDFEGNQDYSKQFVTKLLYTGKGQCHSMPLLYLILANEIGAKANLVYSPSHSYIAFADNENNYYNFECTSACFPSYSFIMSSGYVSKEAIKSGIYTVPVSLKDVIANQLNDLSTQQLFSVKGIDDFQLKCAKRTLEVFPNDIMAMQTMSNYQSAKTEATTCYAGWPKPQDIPNIPELKKEFENRDNLYAYIDNLGYAQMPSNEYDAWLNQLKLEKAKQESELIKKEILYKATLKN